MITLDNPALLFVVLPVIGLVLLGWLVKVSPRCPECDSREVQLLPRGVYLCDACQNLFDYR
jgi:hypothetical protein